MKQILILVLSLLLICAVSCSLASTYDEMTMFESSFNYHASISSAYEISENDYSKQFQFRSGLGGNVNYPVFFYNKCTG